MVSYKYTFVKHHIFSMGLQHWYTWESSTHTCIVFCGWDTFWDSIALCWGLAADARSCGTRPLLDEARETRDCLCDVASSTSSSSVDIFCIRLRQVLVSNSLRLRHKRENRWGWQQNYLKWLRSLDSKNISWVTHYWAHELCHLSMDWSNELNATTCIV